MANAKAVAGEGTSAPKGEEKSRAVAGTVAAAGAAAAAQTITEAQALEFFNGLLATVPHIAVTARFTTEGSNSLYLIPTNSTKANKPKMIQLLDIFIKFLNQQGIRNHLERNATLPNSKDICEFRFSVAWTNITSEKQTQIKEAWGSSVTALNLNKLLGMTSLRHWSQNFHLDEADITCKVDATKDELATNILLLGKAINDTKKDSCTAKLTGNVLELRVEQKPSEVELSKITNLYEKYKKTLFTLDKTLKDAGLNDLLTGCVYSGKSPSIAIKPTASTKDKCKVFFNAVNKVCGKDTMIQSTSGNTILLMKPIEDNEFVEIEKEFTNSLQIGQIAPKATAPATNEQKDKNAPAAEVAGLGAPSSALTAGVTLAATANVANANAAASTAKTFAEGITAARQASAGGRSRAGSNDGKPQPTAAPQG